MNLRGIFTTDVERRYSFRSIKPRHYPIPCDGSLGKPPGAIHPGLNRAGCIHFVVKPKGGMRR